LLLADGVSFLDTQYNEEDDICCLLLDSKNELVHKIVMSLSKEETDKEGKKHEVRGKTRMALLEIHKKGAK
jgi:hypothetical protein